METNPVIVTVQDRIGTIRMNHRPRRNMLGTAMLAGFQDAFDRFTAADARVVIIRAGPDDTVWSAGFDITALADGYDPLAAGAPLPLLFARMRAFPAPVIGMLHGSAWGGGCDLALRCDILIGDPSASLAFTPARLGLPYDLDGIANAVRRAGPAAALEMFATATPIPANRALALGMLNHLVPADTLEDFTLAMARQITTLAPLSVAAAKRQIGLLAQLDDAPLAAAAEIRAAALASTDYRNGVAAFLARRTPEFHGA